MDNTKTVLIVDDSRVSRMMIKAIITDTHADWPVIEAENGDAALEAIAGKTVDIAILDCNMPGMDGFTLAEKIKQSKPETTISLLTANIQEATQKKADAIGISFVKKPITNERIISILDQVD